MSCYCSVEITRVENTLEITAPGPQGRDGRVAPNALVRYSADGVSWHESYMEGDEYFSLSTDGGTVWGGAVFFKGEPGEQGPAGEQGLQGPSGADAPEVKVLYSDDGELWHDTYMAGDDYFSISTDGGSTWGEAIYFRGEQGIQGEIGPAGPTGPEVMVQYSADGLAWNAVYTDGDDYIRFSMDEGNTWGSAVYIRGPQGIPGEDGPKGEPGVQGDPGTPAPELDIQYSADNSSWSDSYTAGDFYARFSTDGGSTWGSGLLIRGEQGIQGDEGPIGNTGPQGPQGIQGPAGADGIDGLDGADGRTILSGTVDPTTEGVDGDFYLNTATSTLFGPKNVTWPTGVSLIGPAGADGADGVGIPTIASGDSGKVLAVKSDESGAEWVDAPSGGGGVSLGLVIALS